MKRALLIAVVVVAVLVGVVVGAGLLLPREHVAATRVALSADPALVFDTLLDVERLPDWRPDLHETERLPDRDGWIERSDFGDLTLEVVSRDRPRLLRTAVADPELPFGGTWTWEIEPTGTGCVVTITENGWVDNPVFRAMSWLVLGLHGAQETYLRNLAQHFGDPPDLERVQ